MSADKSKINKAVLAYSGGLDTSVILKWLQDEYDCEVVTFVIWALRRADRVESRI